MTRRARPSRIVSSAKASALRVSRGSITPWSRQRPEVKKALSCAEKMPAMRFASASIASFGASTPLRRAPWVNTSTIVFAACSPPITPVVALGQANRKSGS